MSLKSKMKKIASVCSLLAVGVALGGAGAEDTITLGLSLPLSGASAILGKGAEWMCHKAASEVNAAGGVKVKGKSYKMDCLAYDNKYTAAEGTKVAQTLMNRDNVKYIMAMGTAPILATESLTDRAGVLMFNLSWGKSSKGPSHPLEFGAFNSTFEIVPAMVKYITKTYPNAKTLVMLNVSDATGKEMEAAAAPMWQKAGIKVLTSDFYERGTTEFQAIAQRLASYKADILDLTSLPPPDVGIVLREMEALNYHPIKVIDNGGGITQMSSAGVGPLEGAYLGAALVFDGPNTNDKQRKISQEAMAGFGDQAALANLCGYDAIYELKAGIEAAQSLDPVEIAKVLPTVKFDSFYGKIGFGGMKTYGKPEQPLFPVYISQVVNGKLVDRAKVENFDAE
jgi:branched-chain amino acid transport system substrate-binding protein